jgi:sulfate/thiosulfate transport system permease protein
MSLVVERPYRRGARSLRAPAVGRWSIRAAAALYLGLMILLPLAVVIVEGFEQGFASLSAALATPGAGEALRLTFITSTVATVLNALFGTLLAYVLVRFRFPLRGLVSAIVDLPFAIPTLVTGVMLLALYGPASPVGAWFAAHGVDVMFAPLGIVLALMFVTLPFVVRTVQPVLLELDEAEEEAATVLGANAWTTFRRIVLPAIRAAIAAGALLAFARALGEFGAIVIVSGNITGRTLTAPVFIFQLASQFRPQEAAAVATVLFAASFLLVTIVNRLIERKEVPAE